VDLLPVLRRLVPNGAWLKRTALLFAFILVDCIVTVSSCKSPFWEANPYAKSFMETYGIAAGLAIYDFLLGLPIYAILCLDSHLIKYTEHHSTKAELAIDLALGWLIAGAHFNGAASWLWDASGMMRQAIGFVIYEVLALTFLYSFPKSVLAKPLPKPELSMEE